MPDSPSEHKDDSAPRQLYRRLSNKSSFGYSRTSNQSESAPESAPVFAAPRPYSTPDATLSSSYHNQPPSPSTAESSNRLADRLSSVSLSTPQIPFYALPRVSSNPAFSGPAMSQSDYDSNTKISSPGFGSLNPLSSSYDRPVTRCPPPSTSSSSSDSSSSVSSNSVTSYTSYPTSQSSSSDSPDKYSSTTPLSSSQADPNISQSRIIDSPPLSRPVSPFRAPQPPPQHQQSSRSLLSQPTAMRRHMLPLHDTPSYPPPDPPVILPAENSTITNPLSFQSQAPHFPFLSHAPPPENSWIEVETLQNEYRLHVRLPGFTREGITLATKRRRILHVVADKWENGGGE